MPIYMKQISILCYYCSEFDDLVSIDSFMNNSNLALVDNVSCFCSFIWNMVLSIT